jgi:hypothetical protein
MQILLLPLLLGVVEASAPKPADIAVVCPAEYRSAMQPWLSRREQQGHTIELVDNGGQPGEIRDRIRKLAKAGALKFVVLVGDAPPAEANAAARSHGTPTFYLPSKIVRYWGGDTEIASDNPYADLNDDGVPELAIGRLSAHSAEELRTIVKKILDYEDSKDFGPWRGRINFVAGEGGYGESIDRALHFATCQAIGCDLPNSYQATLTEALWRSPFCPDPHSFHECCLNRMNEGCLFWVFMGHGSPQSLQWAAFPDGPTPILMCQDGPRLNCRTTPPIALCMCCLTGQLGEPKACLAEELLRAPSGPVAALGASNVSMPYGMAAFARQAVHEYFDSRSETLGQWLLEAKRDTMAGYDQPLWSLLHAVTVAAAPVGIDFKQERLEHLQLFNLFGDPTMQLPHPREVKLSAPETAVAGQSIVVTGKSPIAGNATMELATTFDQLRSQPRDHYDSSTNGRRQFAADYDAANRVRRAAVETSISGGVFSVALPVPDVAPGSYIVRIFISGSDDFAMGACRIQIASPGHERDNPAGPGVASKPGETAIDKIEHR